MKQFFKMAIFSLLITACSQDDTVTETHSIEETKETESQTIKAIDSAMLSFASEDEFREFIKNRIENKENLLEEARTVFEKEGRLSLLLIYKSLEKTEAEKLGLKKEDIAIVDSPDSVLLSMLNSKGELRIGRHIFRIDGDFVYTYTSGNSSEIIKFIEAYNAREIEIKSGTTITFGDNLKVYKHKNTVEQAKANTNEKEIILFNGRKARMIARQWTGFYPHYSSIGSVTKTQVWSKVLWWSQWKDVKTDNRLEFDMTYTKKEAFTAPLAFGKKSHNYCNCLEAMDIYDWSAGFIPAEFYERDGFSKHWAHWYPATPNTVGTTMFY